MPGIELRQEIIGVKDFQNNVARWAMMIDSPPMRKAYDQIIEHITGEIQNMRVPVLTGYLRSTVYGETVIWAPIVEMQFGATASYASYVHETHRTRSGYISRAIEGNQEWVTKMLMYAVFEVFNE